MTACGRFLLSVFLVTGIALFILIPHCVYLSGNRKFLQTLLALFCHDAVPDLSLENPQSILENGEKYYTLRLL